MKKNKVINLFDSKISNPKNDINHTDIFDSFKKSFENDFPDYFDLNEINDFSVYAWNFGNMSTIIPKKEFEKMLNIAPYDQKLLSLLKKMIHSKVTKFKQYDLFIDDFELKELGDSVKIGVSMITPESYLEKIKSEIDSEFESEFEDTEDDFEEGYINRSAVILKPKQPFIDWINKFETENIITKLKEATIYLVDDEIDDLEKWLKKNYSDFFELELVEWNTNKKEWPQKRSYNMFKEWFNADISTFIYDLERYPIHKN